MVVLKVVIEETWLINSKKTPTFLFFSYPQEPEVLE